jgi:hypothetical protein
MPEEMIDHRSELARRFCAALISRRLGIGMDCALKNYVKNAGENEYWLELADRVECEVAEHMDQAIMPRPHILPPTLNTVIKCGDEKASEAG